jgi:THO complex subunit 4
MSNLGALDMALDDVISQNRKRNPNNRRSNTSTTSSNRGGINKRRSGARPSSSVC